MPLSGVAYYVWLEAAPKSWADPHCGLSVAQVWFPAIACFVLPVTLDAALGEGARRQWPAAAVRAAGLGVLVVAAALFIAFLLWFGAHQCGE